MSVLEDNPRAMIDQSSAQGANIAVLKREGPIVYLNRGEDSPDKPLSPYQSDVYAWIINLNESVAASDESYIKKVKKSDSLQLPDYSARRRRIFGSKVLPNIVLVARSEERW